MSAREALVWSVLSRNHRGRQGAIKQRQLAARCGLSTRKLQHVLKSLTERHHKPIASSCREPFGVFVPVTERERQRYIGQLRARATSCFKRLSAVSEAAARQTHRQVQQELWERADSLNTRVGGASGVQRVCLCGCGQSFVPNRGDQLYVDALHRYAAANRRRAS